MIGACCFHLYDNWHIVRFEVQFILAGLLPLSPCRRQGANDDENGL
jgi:hypothetical protein